jgi:DNA-directed RNA polymerase specialized sigma24 family protein
MSRLADRCTPEHLRRLQRIARRLELPSVEREEIVSAVQEMWCTHEDNGAPDDLYAHLFAKRARFDALCQKNTDGTYRVRERPDPLDLDDLARRPAREPQYLHSLVRETVATMDRLPLNWRRAAVLSVLGYSVREIGRIMGTSYGTVCRWIACARMVLRDPERLGEEQESLLQSSRATGSAEGSSH